VPSPAWRAGWRPISAAAGRGARAARRADRHHPQPLPRVVRALAQEQGKNVRLTLEGRDVRVDKSMVELLVDPLMHMVRQRRRSWHRAAG